MTCAPLYTYTRMSIYRRARLYNYIDVRASARHDAQVHLRPHPRLQYAIFLTPAQADSQPALADLRGVLAVQSVSRPRGSTSPGTLSCSVISSVSRTQCARCCRRSNTYTLYGVQGKTADPGASLHILEVLPKRLPKESILPRRVLHDRSRAARSAVRRARAARSAVRSY